MKNNEIIYKPIKRKQKGKLAQPRLHCGPGVNCKAQSLAAVNVIKTILARGNMVESCDDIAKCLAESVRSEYLER